MGWSLYLDDERPCPDGYVLARSTQEALALCLDRGLPERMSLDHDLGDDDTAMRFLRALDELYPEPPYFWQIHSANPVGAKNLEAFLRSWRATLETQTAYAFDGSGDPRSLPHPYIAKDAERIVMLDIDGVLNRAGPDEGVVVRPFPWEPRAQIQVECMDRLRTLLARTDASVVFCSSWRRHLRYSLPHMLRRHFGIDAPVLGMTRLIDYEGRGYKADTRCREIEHWFADAAAAGYPTKRWCWLDDAPGPRLTDHQVVVHPCEGLSDENVEQAVAMLTDGG